MKKFFTLSLLALLSTVAINAQTVVARWNFEAFTFQAGGSATLTPAQTGGLPIADSGILVAGSAVTGSHASASTVWSTPGGNATAKSLSSNNWGVGDYYQFQLSTLAFNNIGVRYSQTGSNTGPSPFKFQYSNDGTTFTDFASYNVPTSLGTTPLISWSATGNPKDTSVKTFDLSSVAAVNNQAIVYFRITCNGTASINGSTVATGGTGRIDDFYVYSGLPTPLSLTSFTGLTNNGIAQLNWTTTNEINVTGFDIEKSTNATEFNKVGFVTAKNASENKYSYSEKFAGAAYYRLKMTDKDGSFKYSSVVRLDSKQSIKLDVFPNPVKDNITISHIKAEGKAAIKIVGIDGKTITVQNIAIGTTQTNINVASLKAGSYLVVFEDASTTSSLQFVKQ